MKTIFRTLGIITIALVIGFAFTACPDSPGGGGGGGGGGGSNSGGDSKTGGSFVPVTNITMTFSETTVGVPRNLTGTVVPANATNKTISWSILDAGSTGATITGSTLNTTATGTAVVKATINNGTASGVPYTQEFGILVIPAPTFGISLCTTGTHPFPSAEPEYDPIDPHTFTITNSGTGATGALTVGLSGGNATSFTLSRTSIPSITTALGTSTFTVVPKDNLSVGTYTATVTVSGGSITSQTFDVSFEVTYEPTYGISLSPSSNHIFLAAQVGYAAQTAHSVTVTNTGNQPTGTLDVTLSGANASSFTRLPSTMSIIAGGSDTFTVVPNNGLLAGTYSATVEVSGGAGIITQSFTVSFTVNNVPLASHYTIGNNNQNAQNVTAVTITPTGGASPGTPYNIRYAGNTAIPQAAGSYAVTINVPAVPGWVAVTDLNVGTLTVTNRTPVASHYTFGNISQSAGIVTAVTITPNAGASPGAVQNIRYAGSTTPPQAAGTYAVTFDVAAATAQGWNGAAGLSAGNLTVTNRTPVASHYTFGNLNQDAGTVTAVSITPNAGMSAGTRTIYYEGTAGTSYTKSTTIPQTEGTYAVTFDVAAAEHWNLATGLSVAGNLVVNPLPFTYIITGSGMSFTARRGSPTGPIVEGANGVEIQDVINAIRTNAIGSAATIQFGDGTTQLAVVSISFNNSGGTWTNPITLTGRITSPNNNATQGTILVSGPSITSTATIANTGTNTANSMAINNQGTGTITISGGTVSATAGSAIYNHSTGNVNISGGTVSTATTTGRAIHNNSTGKITISQDPGKTTLVTSQNLSPTTGTIHLTNSGTETVLEILDGTVSSTPSGIAIYNESTGTIVINGGTVSALDNSAIYNYSTGNVNISGGTVSTGARRTIFNNSTGNVNISGGTVSGGTNQAIHNNSTGNVNISGGTVSATTGRAIHNNSTGKITISEDPGKTTLVTSRNDFAAGGTIVISGGGTATVLEILGGTVENTYTNTIFPDNSKAIYNESSGTIVINGGTVSTTTGRAIHNLSTGNVNISGGTVSTTGTTGRAIHNNSTGKITISQDPGKTTLVTSANTTAASGTIHLGNSGTETAVRLEITGGKVENLAANANSRAIYNESTGTIVINGGTVSATTGRAIHNNSISAINIGGGTVSATTGNAIYNNSSGKITISQDPGKTTLVTSENTTAASGTIHFANSGTATVLEILGGTVENPTANTNSRAIFNGTGTVNISGGTVSATSGRAIHNNSTGAVNISGGTVSATTGNAVYNNSSGKITISQDPGKTTLVTSANTTTTSGTIYLAYSNTTATVFEITGGTVENPTANTSSRAIYGINSSVRVTINGGLVSAPTGTAIWVGSSTTIDMSGGTVSTTSGTAVLGQINMNGGTISATTGTAIYGRIDMSGGTVSTTSGTAVSGGAIMNGGTISATTGTAISIRYQHSLTISQDSGKETKITSENISNNGGTIFVEPGDVSSQANRVTITGGLIENISESSSIRNAFYNSCNFSSFFNITGGTFSTASTTGYAINNAGTGTLTIGPGVTIIGNNLGVTVTP